MTIDMNRRQLLGGFASLGLVALFRSKSRPSMLIEQISEDQILEECEANPSAIDMVICPQYAFRPTRLVIPVAIAHLWTIEDIRIGDVSQLADPGNAIPGEVFAFTLPDTDMSLDTAMVGMNIRMRVRRTEASFKPERFQAAFFGDAVGSGDGRMRRMVLPISSDPYQVIP